jgi:hypothetical protein
MEKINRNNYESHFVDYLEGNLDDQRVQELMAFLEDHPDLKEELEAMKDNLTVPGESAEFARKDLLKKELTLSEAGYSSFDELCIARLEGDLSERQVREHDRFMEENAGKRREYALYGRTLLKPDRRMGYPGKSRLKKRGVMPLIQKPAFRYVALAASVLLLVGLYLFMPGGNPVPYPEELFNEPLVVGHGNENLPVPALPSPDDEIIRGKLIALPPETLGIAYRPDGAADRPEIDRQEDIPEETFRRIDHRLQIRLPQEPLHAGIVEPREIYRGVRKEGNSRAPYHLVNRFLAQGVEKPIKNTLDGHRFSLWEIAGLGFEGISKLTGKELLLKRYYDSKGNLERLALQTESFSLSTVLPGRAQE